MSEQIPNQKNLISGFNSILGTKRTKGSIKFIVFAFLGMLPLLLCCLFFTSTTHDFKQWGPNGFTDPTSAAMDINYGFMWLVGLATVIGSFIILWMFIKFSDFIFADTIPLFFSTSFAMLNMFVIPHSSQWFLFLSLPAFAIIGYVFGVIVMIFIFIKEFQLKIRSLERNGEEVLEKLKERGFFKYQNQSNKNKEPFIDVELKEEDNESSEEESDE